VNKKNITILTLVVLSIVLLCGCTKNEYATVNNANQNTDNLKFIGTWIGDMEFSMFNWNQNSSLKTPHITELEFTQDTVYMTIKTNNGTQTMPQTYEIQEDQLVFSFDAFGERPEFNGERPPFDGEPPADGKRPFGRRTPKDDEMKSRTISYTYIFNEEYTILYLNGSPFLKV